MENNNNVAGLANDLAKAFGFSSAADALTKFSTMYLNREDEAHFMGAIQIVYVDHPEATLSNTCFFVSDFMPEGGGASFYCLSPAAGPDFADHVKKMIEFGRTIQSPEAFMAVIRDPSLCPVPVQREFHSIGAFSYFMFGVVNYKRDKSTDAVTLLLTENFSPIVDTDSLKSPKTPVTSGDKVTPLRPKK